MAFYFLLSASLSCGLPFTGKKRDHGIEMVKSLQNPEYLLDEKTEKNISIFGRRSEAASGSTDASDSGIQREALEPAELYRSGIQDEDGESEEDTDAEDGDRIESSDGEKILKKNLSMRTSDDSSDEENYFTSDHQPPAERNFKEQINFHDGRVRRKAIFENDMDIDHLKVILIIIQMVSYCGGSLLSQT